MFKPRRIIISKIYYKIDSIEITSWIYFDMAIVKYFERISKKRDLSNNLSDEEALKKLREGRLDNSAVSDVSANNQDPFTEGLKSLGCVSILMNCMRNLEKQVNQIFKMLEKTEDRQIKGECQLTDLVKSVEFITQKFDEYEKDRREKDAIIATLQNELKSASMKVEDLEKKNGKAITVL